MLHLRLVLNRRSPSQRSPASIRRVGRSSLEKQHDSLMNRPKLMSAARLNDGHLAILRVRVEGPPGTHFSSVLCHDFPSCADRLAIRAGGFVRSVCRAI